jgi:uncharacterized glyoxalase superfamily protein PhnB
MSEAPGFSQVNLVVGDMDATVAFYRLVGVDLDPSSDSWPPGTGARHVNAGEGTKLAHFDLDNTEMARLWGDANLQPGDTVIGIAVPTRDAVDATYRTVTEAGHKGRLEPYDAFFGARYAIVEDPDGRPVGLMSPRDRDRQYVPG